MKRVTTHIAILMLAVLPAQHSAAEDHGFLKLGEWTDAGSGAVAIDGNIVYLGNGADLQVIDISDPDGAVELKRLRLPGRPSDIEIVGDRAVVVVARSGLNGTVQAVDISDPSSPSVLASVGNIEAQYADVSGDVVIVAGYGPTYFFEFDGEAFSQVSQYPECEPWGCYYYASSADVLARGDYVYVARSGVDVLDVNDPANPILVGNCFPTWNIGQNNMVFSVDDLLVWASYNYLRFFDISEPTNPVLTDSLYVYHLDNSSGFGFVSDHLVFGHVEGLLGIDVTSGQSPSVVWEKRINTKGIALDGTRAFVSRGWCLQEYDLSEPAAPIREQVFPTGGGFTDLSVKGTTAFLVNSPYGLRIVDVSAPDTPVEVGHYYIEEPLPVSQIDAVGDYMCVTGRTAMRVIDVSDPTNPVEAARIPASDLNGDVAVSGNYAFICKQHAGVQILDVSDPPNPIVVHEFGGGDLGGISGRVLAGEGNRLYVTATGYNGFPKLHIYDISDIRNPVRLGTFSLFDFLVFAEGTYSSPYEIVVSNGHLYLPSGRMGLRIVDVNDPAAPIEVARFDTHGGTTRAFAAGTFVYFMDTRCREHNFLKTIDVSHPATPIEVGSYAGSFYPYCYRDLVVDDGIVYAMKTAGLETFEFHWELPKEIITPGNVPQALLNQNYPNPFNPTTTISFLLSRQDYVTLTVYDVSGQPVRTLIDGLTEEGLHSASWDGTDRRGRSVASGVYFYRLVTSEFEETRKMTLVK